MDRRPKEYWKPGAQVTLEAPLSGVDTGDGRYVAKSYSASVTIGRSRTAKVDIANHRLTLERDGRAVKSVPISAGDPGGAPDGSGRSPVWGRGGVGESPAQRPAHAKGPARWTNRSTGPGPSFTYRLRAANPHRVSGRAKPPARQGHPSPRHHQRHRQGRPAAGPP